MKLLSQILVCLLLVLPVAAQSIPQTIHYQGYLRDTEGQPISGWIVMEVRVYGEESGSVPVYTEFLGGIEVTNGHYQLSFGASGVGSSTNAQIELVEVTDGANNVFSAILNSALIETSLVVGDGTYTWNPVDGSSSSTAFQVIYHSPTRKVTVSYLKGNPPAGVAIYANYDVYAEATLSTVLTDIGVEQAYFALVIDGVETNVRSKLHSVPYAMHAMSAVSSQDATELANVVYQLTQDVAGIQSETQDGLSDLSGQLAHVGGDVTTLLSILVSSGNHIPEGMVRVAGGKLPAISGLGAVDVPSFQIGITEVTWAEWQTVRTWAAANGYDIGIRGAGCAENHPVRSVNWYDVLKWCNAKSEMEGMTPYYRLNGNVYRTGEAVPTRILASNGYRLPTEVEWLFAARGGNQTNGYTYAGSNDLSAVGWYLDNASGAACNQANDRGTWPVGQKAANELGLYDMSGNVLEWCWDQIDSFRPVLGGGWSNLAADCAVSRRTYGTASRRSGSDGFRLARNSGF